MTDKQGLQAVVAAWIILYGNRAISRKEHAHVRSYAPGVNLIGLGWIIKNRDKEYTKEEFSIHESAIARINNGD